LVVHGLSYVRIIYLRDIEIGVCGDWKDLIISLEVDILEDDYVSTTDFVGSGKNLER
jgi:hypothetical protein